MYRFSRFLLLCAVAVLALVLAGCTAVMPAGQQPAAGAGEAAAAPAPPLPTPEPGTLTVTDVRARPAPLEGGNGAVFLTVLNGLDSDVQFLGITGDIAGAIELHETVDDNGVMKMEPHPEGFTVPAGSVLQLQPGGKHVMLFGLAKPLVAGDSFELTLNFDAHDPITVTVPVVEMLR